MRSETRASVIAWAGLLFTAVLLIFFGLWCAEPAGAQPLQPCVTEDPRPTLWPGTACRWNNTSGVEAPFPLDRGALRLGAGGCWETWNWLPPTAGSGPTQGWVLYDPSNHNHVSDANFFQAFGRGHTWGPPSNEHDETCGRYDRVCSSPATQALYVCDPNVRPPLCALDSPHMFKRWSIEHCRDQWKALRDADLRLGTEEGGGNPPDPVVVNPCDGTCQDGLDRVCRDGLPVGGRCPSDCEAPCPPPESPPCNGICDRASDIVRCPEDCLSEPPVCPPCPACETAELNTALDRCEAEMASCGAEKGVLKSKVVELEVHLDGALRSLGACETMIEALTAEKDGLKAIHAEPLPTDLEAYLRSQKPPLLSGLGRRAKYRRLAGPVCQRWSCPEDLKP